MLLRDGIEAHSCLWAKDMASQLTYGLWDVSLGNSWMDSQYSLAKIKWINYT